MPSLSEPSTMPLATASCLARAEASNSTGRVTIWKSSTAEKSRAPSRITPVPERQRKRRRDAAAS